MKVLILGARGRVGSAIFEAIQANTNSQESAILASAEVVDIRDVDALLGVIESDKINVVINAAASGVRGGATTNDMLEVNANAPRRLVEALSQVRRPVRLLQIASALERRPPHHTDSVYVVSKRLGSESIRNSFLSRIGQAKIVYIHNVYSRHQDESFLWEALSHAVRGESFFIEKPWVQRDFCWIGDVTDGTSRILRSWVNLPREIEIGTGESWTLWEAAHCIFNAVGADSKLILGRPFLECDGEDMVSHPKFLIECSTHLQRGLQLLIGDVE